MPRTKKIETRKKVARTPKKSGGLRVDVYDTKGKVLRSISLPKEIFATKVNPSLMAQAVRVYLANQRKGTATTKSRGQVQGSTRKIYKQKGTGRARHGAIRAPIFVGGGVVFGPKMRDYSLSLSKNMKKAALFSALSSRCSDKGIAIVAGLEKLTPKTKEMAKVLTRLPLENKKKILLVLSDQKDQTSNVYKAARNIEGVSIIPAKNLNTYEVLNTNTLLFMEQAVPFLQKHFLKE